MSSSPKDTSPSEENKPKWTPGPWYVPEDYSHDVRANTSPSDRKRFGTYFQLCHVRGWNMEDTKANAHLIAAAPDLYEALFHICDALHEDDDLSARQIARHAGCVALAKARGEK